MPNFHRTKLKEYIITVTNIVYSKYLLSTILSVISAGMLASNANGKMNVRMKAKGLLKICRG